MGTCSKQVECNAADNAPPNLHSILQKANIAAMPIAHANIRSTQVPTVVEVLSQSRAPSTLRMTKSLASAQSKDNLMQLKSALKVASKGPTSAFASATSTHMTTSKISEAFAMPGQEPSKEEVFEALLASDLDNMPYMKDERTFHHTALGALACMTYGLTDDVAAGRLHMTYNDMIGDLQTWGACIPMIV